MHPRTTRNETLEKELEKLKMTRT